MPTLKEIYLNFILKFQLCQKEINYQKAHQLQQLVYLHL